MKTKEELYAEVISDPSRKEHTPCWLVFRLTPLDSILLCSVCTSEELALIHKEATSRTFENDKLVWVEKYELNHLSAGQSVF